MSKLASQLNSVCNINIVSGHFLKENGIFSNQDPYIAFEYNSEMYKTTVKKKAGLNAEWNERFEIKNL